MSRVAKLCVVLATGLATLAACRSPATQPSSAQASIASAEQTKKNVRKLRATLPGKPMKEVVGISRTTLAGVHIGEQGGLGLQKRRLRSRDGSDRALSSNLLR